MIFGTDIDEQMSAAVLSAALDEGINFLDTSNFYGRGRSEEVLGNLLAGRRRDVIVATKVGLPIGPGPNDQGLSRNHVIQSVEDSLRRLKTDYIDIYYAHFPDWKTPLEETLRAWDDLIHQGKVRYLGCSNYPAWYVCRALWTSSTHNLNPLVCVQPLYNLLDRQAETEMFPFCAHEGVGVVPYNPLAGGLLTGKYHRDKKPAKDSRYGSTMPVSGMGSTLRGEMYTKRYWHDVNFDAIDQLIQVAHTLKREPLELALGWVLQNPIVTSSIVGARNASQIIQLAKVTDMAFSLEEMEMLTDIRGVSFS